MTNSSPTFFNGDGVVITTFGTGNDTALSMLMQPDGRILVGGWVVNGSNVDFALARYNEDGSLDATFGTAGKLTTAFGVGDDLGVSVALQGDGRILLGGWSSNGSNNDFALARYNSDGSLDTSFSGDGKVTTPMGSSNAFGLAVLVQSDGKIILVGDAVTGSTFDVALARYNGDGTLDTSFSGDGKVTTPVGSSFDVGYGAQLLSSGKILVSGYSESGAREDFILLRYNADGSLDNSFGSGGKVVTSLTTGTDRGRRLAVQSDDKIIVVGQADLNGNANIGLVRYNADGTLDTTFDLDGKVVTDVAGLDDFGLTVAVQTDGKIVVAGGATIGGKYEILALRYNADGSLDTSFHDDGISTVAVGATMDAGYGLAIDAQGRILVSGTTSNGANDDIVVVRFNADGTLDATFDGVTTLDGTASHAEGGAPTVLDADVQIRDRELAAAGSYAGAVLTIMRQGGAIASDVLGASGNLAFVSGNAVLGGITIGAVQNANGRLDITFNASATQARVDEALSSLTFATTAQSYTTGVATPITIAWSFSDGASPASSPATGSTSVSVTGVNDAPTGATGLRAVDAAGVLTLTAATAGVADLDGMPGVLSHVWQSSADGITWIDVAGPATSPTYLPSLADAGRFLQVVVSYTDTAGTTEHIVSIADALPGDGANNNLIGTARDNLMLGRGGNDTLDGAGGNDTLNGGEGADRLNGGTGNDVIVWDPVDQLDFVLGGADIDALLVVDLPAPTTFDLTAHQLERAVVIANDLASTNWWEQVSSYYDAAWQLTNQDTIADTGSLVQTTYDVSPGGGGVNWQYISDYRTGVGGTLTNQDGVFDDGTTFAKSYDYAAGTGVDGIADELAEFTYFFRNVTDQQNGVARNVEGFYDDGRKFTQTNDIDSAYAWTYQTNWYETDGVTLDFLEIRWDNGSTQIVPY